MNAVPGILFFTQGWHVTDPVELHSFAPQRVHDPPSRLFVPAGQEMHDPALSAEFLYLPAGHGVQPLPEVVPNVFCGQGVQREALVPL